MPLTEREKFERFIEKYGPVIADAFYWCGGSSWERRTYCSVVLTKKATRSIAVEFRCDTPYALAKEMRSVGYAARADVVRRLCESAPRSPKRAALSRRRTTPAMSREERAMEPAKASSASEAQK